MLAQFRAVWTLRRITTVTKCFLCRSMSSFSRNCDFIYIAFPDIPVYLNRVELKEIESESRAETGPLTSKFFDVDAGSCFIVFAENNSDTDFQNRYIHSAIKSQTIYRKSAEWKFARFSHSVCKQGRGLDSVYKRGVCLHGCPTKEEKSDIPEKLLELSKQDNNFIPYELCRYNKSNALILKRLDDSSTDDEEVVFSISTSPANGAATVSPLFAIPEISPVYHSYEEARTVLEKIAGVPEVTELLEISSKHVSMDILKAQRGDLPHPFVVVEGMDATGKTTLTEELEKRLGAVRHYTPPRQITHLRAHFDRYPEIVRRAYYSMGNYIVAMEIIEECQNRPVIMDRFWHSTTAYGIANETSSGDLPDVDNDVYVWPSDLLRPNLVLFLTVSEDVRKQRLSGRGVQATFEEKSLDKDLLFRQRLCECYRRMSRPSCVEIDAGGTVEEVRNKAIDVLQEHGVSSSED